MQYDVTSAADRAAVFCEQLNSATAAISPAGMVHDVQCPTVRGHLTAALRPGSCLNWNPWRTISEATVVGKSCHLCSPPVTIQAKRRRVRLTGIGWPSDDGRCAKGHLPRWERVA
jgi:hypothetical protein